MMVSAQREFPRPSIRTCSSGGHYSRPGLVRFQRLTPLCGFWTNKDSFVVFAEAIRIKLFLLQPACEQKEACPTARRTSTGCFNTDLTSTFPGKHYP